MKTEPPQRATRAADFTQQRPSYQIPKRSWLRRNPRAFQVIFISTCMISFFSKPLYDLFFTEAIPNVPKTNKDGIRS